VLISLGVSCDDGNSTAEGVILEVEASTLTEVESFTLLVEGGEVLTFKIAPDASQDREEGFVPGHLRSHALASERVEIVYRVEDGDRLALSLHHD